MNNEYIQYDGFGISYNPNPGSFISFFGSDHGGGETAIVVNPEGREFNEYYILNGDFRAEYKDLAKEGLNACLMFFANHPDLISSWSDSREAALAHMIES